MDRRITWAHVCALIAGVAVVWSVLLLTTDAEAAPYGGCEEAWQAPRSDGAADCRRSGWTIRPRLVVNPHGVVKMSALPHCRYEDGAGQTSACTWNFEPVRNPDGNGKGAAYWIGPKNRTHFGDLHYVWAHRPRLLTDGWHWSTRAERQASGVTRACLVRDGTTVEAGLIARCPG